MSNHGGGMGRRRMPNEKAKDFSGSMKKLLNYMKRYKNPFLSDAGLCSCQHRIFHLGTDDPR